MVTFGGDAQSVHLINQIKLVSCKCTFLQVDQTSLSYDGPRRYAVSNELDYEDSALNLSDLLKGELVSLNLYRL